MEGEGYSPLALPLNLPLSIVEKLGGGNLGKFTLFEKKLSKLIDQPKDY